MLLCLPPRSLCTLPHFVHKLTEYLRYDHVLTCKSRSSVWLPPHPMKIHTSENPTDIAKQSHPFTDACHISLYFCMHCSCVDCLGWGPICCSVQDYVTVLKTLYVLVVCKVCQERTSIPMTPHHDHTPEAVSGVTRARTTVHATQGNIRCTLQILPEQEHSGDTTGQTRRHSLAHCHCCTSHVPSPTPHKNICQPFLPADKPANKHTSPGTVFTLPPPSCRTHTGWTILNSPIMINTAVAAAPQHGPQPRSSPRPHSAAAAP